MSEDGAHACTTYWGKCSFTGASPPWELEWYPERGYVAISAQDFKAGDLICAEHPTTYTRAWHPFSEEQKVQVDLGVQALGAGERKAFLDMSNVFPEEPPSSGIYMTNAFDMPSYDEDEGRVCGMFLAIGRLNHSCLPNAQQTFIPRDEDGGKGENGGCGGGGFEVLYASRDIARGDELCDCYIELRQGAAQRQAQLQGLYRFTCNCPACQGTCTSADIGTAAATAAAASSATGTGAYVSLDSTTAEAAPAPVRTTREDDARRLRALRLERDQLTFVEMGELDRAIELGLELVALLKSPLSAGWGERFSAEACATTAALLLEQGHQRPQALRLLQQAHTWNVRLQGELSVDSLASAAKLAKLGKRGRK